MASVLEVEGEAILFRPVGDLRGELACVNDVEIGDFSKEARESINVARAFDLEERHVSHNLKAFDHGPHLVQ